LAVPGEKSLARLSNSKPTVIVESRSPDYWGKLVVRKGDNPVAWKPTKDVKEYLGTLSGKKFSGKKAATFDTQLKSAVSGNANKAMEEGLTGLGYTIACPHLQAYVHGKKDAYMFLDGEEEKAKKWGKDLAEALKK